MRVDKSLKNTIKPSGKAGAILGAATVAGLGYLGGKTKGALMVMPVGAALGALSEYSSGKSLSILTKREIMNKNASVKERKEMERNLVESL